MKEVTVCGYKKIYIFDDLFSFGERSIFYKFILNSKYMIDGGNGPLTRYHNHIFSNFCDDDVINMGFYNTKGFDILNNKFNFNKTEKKQIRVNCSTSSESCEIHNDGKGLTLLYYVNLNWELSWSGHTLFLNENITDIEYAAAYKPGRIVVFDGTIPHMITLPNHQAKDNRLTFVIQYK
jgi:hypothetical protein